MKSSTNKLIRMSNVMLVIAFCIITIFVLSDVFAKKEVSILYIYIVI